MKSVVITGAAGLVGQQLSKLCLLNGWQVCAVSRDAPVTDSNSYSNISFDLSLPFDLSLLPRQVDVVVHLAQSNYYRDFPANAEDLYGVNVGSTFRLLDYAHTAGASQFIYASTGGLYIPSRGCLSENSAIHPRGKLGAYYASKTCGELLVQTYSSHFSATILRPFFIYGPAQKSHMLFPRLLSNVRSCNPIKLQGEHGLTLNPIHCLDAAKAIIHSIKNPSSAVINIAGPEVLTIRQIATLFAKHCNVQPVFEHLSGEPQSLIADISLMKSSLGSPSIKFSDVIDELL